MHTTQGGSAEGALSVFRSVFASSQLLIEPWPGGRKIQLIDLDRNGASLRRGSGPPTNGMGRNVQVEVVGFAEDAASWPQSWKDRLARMIRQVNEAVGIPYSAVRQYGPGAGWILASQYARQRFSEARWAGFSGWCGHQNVPRNDHWNPGGLPLIEIVQAADPAHDQKPPPEPTTIEENPLMDVFIARTPRPGGKETYQIVGIGETSGFRYPVSKAEAQDAARPAAGVYGFGPERALPIRTVPVGRLAAIEALAPRTPKNPGATP